MKNVFIIGLTLVILIGAIVAFSGWDSLDEGNTSKGDQVYIQEVPVVTSEIPESDDVTVQMASMSGEDLILALSYPGCQGHTFSLYVDDSTYGSDLPVVRATVVHNLHGDNGSACEKANQSTVDFSLTTLSEKFGNEFQLSVVDSQENATSVSVSM